MILAAQVVMSRRAATAMDSKVDIVAEDGLCVLSNGTKSPRWHKLSPTRLFDQS